MNVPHRCFLLITFALMMNGGEVHGNIPGGGTGTGANVTLVDNGSTVTISNGVVSIVCTKSGATINQINYTYNNGGGATTYQMLTGGKNGGQLYWTNGGFGTGSFAYSLVANPSSNGGNYAEISLLSASASNGTMEVHFSMRRGSPGFYVTVVWGHRSVDAAMGTGELRQNIYTSPIFSWYSVDAQRNFQYNSGSAVPVAGAPQEVSLWTSGFAAGTYEDKYKYSSPYGQAKVWGHSSVTNPLAGTVGKNIGIWYCFASPEYFNGGPLKCENTDAPMIVSIHGGHYQTGEDCDFAAGEVWTHVSGPYFVYCNAIPNTITNPSQAANALFDDAKAQAAAEKTAWPYSWFVNPNYTPAANRGTVTGKMVINDAHNPNASAANLWVGVVQQPVTSTGAYDFQQWSKSYQFWAQTDSSGNFTIPNVIAGSNYTLYAFGPGANGTFMSQNQTGGNPPMLFNLPASPFGVAVTGGVTKDLGAVTWTPARVGPTVFEIGYPDRTARKFRHGEDWWTGDIGPSPTSPSAVWTKFLEYPYDFPNDPNYIVGQSRWSTDWNFVQPNVVDSAGNKNGSSSAITFNLAAAPANGATASLYIATASDDAGPLIVNVNGNVLVSGSGGVTAVPSTLPSTGYFPSESSSDTTVREGVYAAFADERIGFPASLLHQGQNTIKLTMRKGGNLAYHAMYDYLRLEMPGYVPPAPVSVAAYAGNNSALVSWPVTPGATSYNILRSTTSGSGYSLVASNVAGPVCGSGLNNATYLDAATQNGTTYYYVVQSVNSVGVSANSAQSPGVAPFSGAPAAAPAAPTGLTATKGDHRVNLSWNASSGANYYTIQRSTLVSDWGGSFNNLGTITLTNAATGAAYTDTSPTNGSLYSYTVVANNAAGASAPAATTNIQPASPAPGNAPGGLTAVPGIQQVSLTWNTVSGATGYTISNATTLGGPYTYVATVQSLNYTDTGLADNTSYYYVVSAVNSGGASANSTEAGARTTPAAPATLTAIAGNTQAQLNWSASAGATGYTVRRGTATGVYTVVVGNVTGTSFADAALSNGTTYYYAVAASSASGIGANSVEAAATPISSVPVAPVNITATAGNTQVALSWSASVGATSYTSKRSTASGGPYTTVSSGLTGTSLTDAGRINGTMYFYVVMAVNASGSSVNSAEAGAIPGAAIDQWRQKYFGTMSATGNAADGADPEGDGRVNLIEYAVGSNPTVRDVAPPTVPGVTAVSDHVTFTFSRIADPSLTYNVEAVDNLLGASWPSIWSSSGNANIAGSVTVTDPETLVAPSQRFLRLRVSR